MIHPVIAIDGPSASGKGTVASALAAKLGFIYVDTGAMYRAFAWAALEKNVDLSSREAIKNLIKETKFETEISEGKVILKVNGTDVAPLIREPRINQAVSPLAAVPEMREYLVNRQRQLRLQAPLVMEGRDIGTVVAPDTSYKFFLDADPSIREERRRLQGQIDPLRERDRRDSTRAASPLMQAADAEKIDTGKMTAEEVVEYILNRLKKKGFSKTDHHVSPV